MIYKLKVTFIVDKPNEYRGFPITHSLKIFFDNPITGEQDSLNFSQGYNQSYQKFISDTHEKVFDKKWVSKVLTKRIQESMQEEADKKMEDTINSLSYIVEVEVE